MRRFLVGASAANLALIPLWNTFFQYRDPDSFFLTISRLDLLAAWLNLFCFGLLAWGGGRILDRWKGPAAPRVAAILQVLFGVTLLNIARLVFHLTPDGTGQWAGAVGPLGLGVIGLLGAAGCGFIVWKWPVGVNRGVAGFYLIASPFLVLTLARSVWIAATGHLPERFADREPSQLVTQNPPVMNRVVVVIFDEFDFHLGFVARPAGLQLPELDRLRSEALFADSAIPPAPNTNESMPSMVMGQVVADLRSIDSRGASVRLDNSSDRANLSELTSIFSQGVNSGIRSGLVGWNIPYCRSGLGAGLVQCAWWPSGLHLGVPEPLGTTMLHQWLSVSPWNNRGIHRVRHDQMLAAAKRMAADQTLNLVFLHLAVPHYPWIFDQRTGRFTLLAFSRSGYVGNLALADRDLGTIRRAIAESGLEDGTTLIVTSDHPWREAEQFEGVADLRVPFMIQSPGGKAGTFSPSFPTVRTGALALALLRGSLETTDKIQEWMNTLPQPGQ